MAHVVFGKPMKTKYLSCLSLGRKMCFPFLSFVDGGIGGPVLGWGGWPKLERGSSIVFWTTACCLREPAAAVCSANTLELTLLLYSDSLPSRLSFSAPSAPFQPHLPPRLHLLWVIFFFCLPVCLLCISRDTCVYFTTFHSHALLFFLP